MGKQWSSLFIITFFELCTFTFSRLEQVTPPPLPILPLPTYDQLKWQQREIIMFLHFGVNTFTGLERGTGNENPAIFNPVALDASQWVSVAEDAGISLMILTAKHHDGFCLWPSKYTDHTVKKSPWKNGHGDVVQELVDAAKPRGVDVGLYLSPWDRHDHRYGMEKPYNEYYLAQLQELLTRWVGNENGFAGESCWSTINRTLLSIGNASIEHYLNRGDPKGTDWLPAESDVSIRKGWFWHSSESPKKLSQLLKIYYNSVGRNSVLLLNVPPNSTGLISEVDVERLREFRTAIDTIFSTNVAEKCSIKVSSQRGGIGGGFGSENVLDNDHLWTYWAPRDGDKDDHWIEFRADEGMRFNVIRIQEAIGLGQRIKRHKICVDGKVVANGTTVGYKRLHRLNNGVVHGQTVRIRIEESRGNLPLISSIGLHFDPYWHPEKGV
ncbi:hypothetical protein ACLB2K_070312 [Fragaria x ananassa]